MKKELFLGIKNFFYSRTTITSNKVISVNYKKAENNNNYFIISKQNSFFIVNLNGKFVTDITINFKEPLKENIKFKMFSEKYDNKNNNLKNINFNVLIENISYKANIDDSIKSLIFIIGENIGDSFVLDNVIYNENYKYYFIQLLNFNYLAQLKLKSFWLLFLKIFLMILFVVEYFVIRKIIYKKVKVNKK